MSKLLTNQMIFAQNIGKLIYFVFANERSCTLGEVYRTQEQANWYAAHGMGITHSQHCDRLALDLFLFSGKDKYLTEFCDYEPFGLYWESLHRLNRWGGHFSKPDVDHFEMRDS